MKTLIKDIDGFKFFAEVHDIESPAGCQILKFTTQWNNAKHPDEEQVKFQLILSKEEREILKNLL